VQNLSHENEFDVQEQEHAGGTQVHTNGFGRIFVTTPRQQATRNATSETYYISARLHHQTVEIFQAESQTINIKS